MVAKLKPLFHIVIGISGGVDSSVAAYLLKKEGHHVDAIFMKNWEADTTSDCSISKDLNDAEVICEQLKINLSVVNFAKEYWERVFLHFLDEYRQGRTPNPDILCNKEIKFSAFLDFAKKHGADYIATGHYVRKKETSTGTYLQKGSDPLKDQSYFLHALNETQLAQSLFPVGELTKEKVRGIAKEIGLKNFAKKDSTGICFIGERKFNVFLKEYLPAKPGNIETPEGEVVGIHDGLMFYTIGQRQGLLIGGLAGKKEEPWYVLGKDLEKNVLLVVQGDDPLLYQSALFLNHIHWINQKPAPFTPLFAKTRYRQKDERCELESLQDGRYRVVFHAPQRAITKGQSVVFYQDDICLGGGIIDS
jgi:tRNA-specific 2-thiouridylase